MKILLADDNHICRNLLARILACDGANEVTLAEDGKYAWDILRGPVRFDMVVLDVVMPRISGLELLEQIRMTPGLRDLPVMLCTAANDRFTIEQARRLSANQYILKPYDTATVRAKLQLVAAAARPFHGAFNAEVEAGRLGLAPDVFKELSGTLVNEIRAWISRVVAKTQRDKFTDFANEANALKGAALNMGLRQLSDEIGVAEIAMTREAASIHQELFPITPSELMLIIEPVALELAEAERLLSASGFLVDKPETV